MNAATEPAEAASQAENLSRRQLYDLVWSTPLTELAKRFHLSDVGLAKVCKKHNIPRPGVGYWAQIKWGQTPPQSPLTECQDESLERIVFDAAAKVEAKKLEAQPRVSDPELARRIVQEAEPNRLIVVSEQVSAFHPLLQGLKQPTQDDLKYQRYPVCNYTRFFCVSKGQFDRGRRILSTLLKAAEARGYRLDDSGEKRSGELAVSVLDATFYLSLREPTQRHPVPPSERKSSYERYRYTPSGKLELHCGDMPKTYDPKVWRDLKKKPLEHRLNEVMIAWLEGVERQRADRAERERWEAEYREKQRRIQEEALRAQQEKARIDRLYELHNAWRNAESLRDFLQQIDERLSAAGDASDETAWREWLEWARDYCDRLDPLTGDLSSLAHAAEGATSDYRRRPR